MLRRFQLSPPLLALCLAVMVTSCSTIAKNVADKTVIRLKGVHIDNPAHQGLTVVKELLGAIVGSAPTGRDGDLSITIQLYLENKNSFALNLSKVTYTFTVDGKPGATGARKSEKGEMSFEPGEGKVVELPAKVFTHELASHVLQGVANGGAIIAVKGQLTFETALGEVTFPYNAEKKM